jgi:hypothetical protein
MRLAVAKLEVQKWSDRVLDGQISSMSNKISVEEDKDKKALMQSYLESLKAEKYNRSKGK